MIDSTTPLVSIPRDRKVTRIAVYFNGLFAATPAEVDQLRAIFPGVRVYFIDVLGNAPDKCSIADIEKEDMTADDYPGWAEKRLVAVPGALCRPYCNLSTWPTLRAVVRNLPQLVKDRTRYFIANPTNPPFWHLVPGSSATQYEWGQLTPGIGNIDISAVDERTWDQV